MLKKEIREKIDQKSLSLEKYGLNDLAWRKEDALNLIQAIMHDPIGILGGDVYRLNHGRIEPLCDNWCCKSDAEENYKKSKVESLNYIKKYDIGNDESIIFSITFTEQLV